MAAAADALALSKAVQVSPAAHVVEQPPPSPPTLSMTRVVVADGETLCLRDLIDVAEGRAKVAIDEKMVDGIRDSQAVVQGFVDRGDVV